MLLMNTVVLLSPSANNFEKNRETLLLPCPVRVDRITPLLRNPGCIMVTDARYVVRRACVWVCRCWEGALLRLKDRLLLVQEVAVAGLHAANVLYGAGPLLPVSRSLSHYLPLSFFLRLCSLLPVPHSALSCVSHALGLCFMFASVAVIRVESRRSSILLYRRR